MMKKISATVFPVLCILSAFPCWTTAEEFQPQHLTVKAAIDPGANIFTNDQEWNGASSIDVFSAADLAYKGNMSSGSMAQMLVSPDGKTAYTVSVYLKRYAYGEPEMVLQAFDVATLSPLREIALPPKFAMGTAYTALLAQSADGRYIYVQNATPATSVTVVDVVAGTVTGEIPTPGCFGIYPSVAGTRFSVACGDGTFASYALEPDGKSADRAQSEKIFDVDSDPIFMHAQRIGPDLLFISYHGNVYRLSDSGAAVQLAEKYSVTDGVRGGWAPGGYEMIAYNKSNNVLFIGMHPNAKDGSHKQGAKEIWAYDLAARKTLSRSAVPGALALTVSDDKIPVLYAVADGGSKDAKTLIRFEASPTEKFALRKTAVALNPGEYNLEVALRP
jgi:methylamine dehydrogenase heavy chain